MNLNEYLEAVEIAIVESLHAQAPEGLEESRMLLDAGRHLATAPGAKRARPRLVYHFGETLGANPADLVSIALSGEFIHGASLMHDDVVDAGTMRRGRPTVNARWNNSVAVLGGDVMLCIAIESLSGLPRPITNEAVAVVATMSRAAILEVESRGNIDLSLDQWAAIARGKTGSLFAWCGRSPALLMGDEDAAERFQICGDTLGLAFQLADDLKDIVSADSGKDRFSDVRNRNPSHPVLTAASRSPALREELRALWAQEHISNEEAHDFGYKVLDTGAADATRDAILTNVERAFAALGPYRDTAGGRAVADWAANLARVYLAEAEAHMRGAE